MKSYNIFCLTEMFQQLHFLGFVVFQTGTGQKPPDKSPLDKSLSKDKSPPPLRTKSPHNEIIIQSYFIFVYIDGDIKDILKIKSHPY